MKKSFLTLLKSKQYIPILLISAIAAYAYAVTHSAVDIDDTAIPLYFQQGLATYVNRWTLFVFFRIFHISADFSHTVIVEGLSILILCISVTIWCALWKWIIERYISLPDYIYGIISAVFITNPIISEVFIYFLHNGICIAYGLTGIALYTFLRSTAFGKKNKILYILISTLTLAAATGCYESFLLVFVMGAFLVYMTIRGLYAEAPTDQEFAYGKILPWIFSGGIVITGTLIIRSVMYRICLHMYDAGAFADFDVKYRKFFGENLTAVSELGMTLKRYISLYHINGMMYIPITVLIIARITILLFGIISSVRKKDITIALATAVIYVLPPFMAVLEGNVTKYRSAQYIPMISAYALLLVSASARKHFGEKKRAVASAVLILQAALVVFQSVNMNRWFYANYQKYEYAKETMIKVAEDLRAGNYDLTKPIVFVGACKVPADITAYGSVPFTSRRFRIICRLTDPVDPHWKEKYYSEIPGLGYIYNASPQESILQWGTDAFNHTDEQMIRFWEMLGYNEFISADTTAISEGNLLQENLNIPSVYSGEDYIYETYDFLLVNIEAN